MGAIPVKEQNRLYLFRSNSEGGLSRIEDGHFLTQKRSFGVPKVQVKAAFLCMAR